MMFIESLGGWSKQARKVKVILRAVQCVPLVRSHGVGNAHTTNKEN